MINTLFAAAVRLFMSLVLWGTFLAVFGVGTAYAQIGGQETFTFLKLPVSARTAALGGVSLALADDDVNLAATNPAALTASVDRHLAFNIAAIAPTVTAGYGVYAQHFAKAGLTAHIGVQFLNYGTMTRTNEAGDKEGDFSAAENAVTLGIGKTVNERLRFGVNLRYISSRLDSYQSSGLTGDIAVMYDDTTHGITLALVAANVGGQLKSYTAGNIEQVPTDVQVSFAKRFKHLPFRFLATYHHLQKYNIRYDDPNAVQTSTIFGAQTTDAANQSPVIDNLARHFVFGGELLFGKRENFRIRFSYNHLQHAELTVKDTRGLAGFALGAGIKTNKFRIEYAHTWRHFAGGTDYFSVAFPLGEFVKKRTTAEG